MCKIILKRKQRRQLLTLIHLLVRKICYPFADCYPGLTLTCHTHILYSAGLSLSLSLCPVSSFSVLPPKNLFPWGLNWMIIFIFSWMIFFFWWFINYLFTISVNFVKWAHTSFKEIKMFCNMGVFYPTNRPKLRYICNLPLYKWEKNNNKSSVLRSSNEGITHSSWFLFIWPIWPSDPSCSPHSSPPQSKLSWMHC